MNKRILAIIAAVLASTAYGLNHTVAKVVMPEYIEPFGFILLRVLGASIVFWIISLFLPQEKIERKDWPRLIACAIFGMVLNMLFFFKGLELSTPINSSVIVTLSPVMVLILSALILKERITWLKGIGVLLGLAGAIVLVLFSVKEASNAPNIPLGNALFIINGLSFGFYLIFVKPLSSKYNVITLMKWLFLIAVFINFPVTISEFSAVHWQELPFAALWRMGFVVIASTVLASLLNLYAIRHLNASTLSVFMYLQPLIAIIYSITVGADSLTSIKIVAGSLVFLGVFLVTRKKKIKKDQG